MSTKKKEPVCPLHRRYQPKGGMCMSCAHVNEDCSHLEFDRMRVIAQHADVVIVRCAAFQHFQEAG